MTNLNELLGIINGINYDGVINDKEISYLKEWIKNNGVFAYNKKDIDLIDTIENILEDNIIDNEERKRLIELVSECDTKKHEIDFVLELSGLLEGISSDGEINKKEKEKSKKWIKDNETKISNNNVYTDILASFKEIINESNNIKIESRRILFNDLYEKVEKLKNQAIINHLIELVKNKENIGFNLIEIYDNKSLIKEIHKRAENKLISSLNTYTGQCNNAEIVVISLSIIAMKCYDGGFYNYVREIYVNTYRKFKEQEVEGLIRSILNIYKDSFDSSKRELIINVALENTIVPYSYLPRFFEFIYDIFKINFNCSIPDDLYDELLFVYNGIKDKLSEKDEELKINVTNKAYKLIRTTKNLILKENSREELIKLSIIILRIINSRYWNRDIDVNNDYLKYGLENWDKSLIDINYSDVRNRKIERKNKSLSRWEPQFIIDDYNVYLVPPIHKIKADFDYRKIQVIIYADNEIIYNNNSCDIREIIGGYEIRNERIKIDNPLANIRYCVKVEDDVIYDSKDKLYRGYIIFDSEGYELKNNKEYEGSIQICYHSEDYNSDDYFECNNYKIAHSIAEKNGFIKVKNDIFSFSNFIKPGIGGVLRKNYYLYNKTKDTYLSVYDSIDNIFFEVEDTEDNIEILINDKRYRISDFDYTKEEVLNKNRYNVKINLNNSNLYTITVNQIKEGNIKRIDFQNVVIDNGLDFNIISNIDKNYCINIKSDIAGERTIDFNISEFKIDLINFKYGNCDYNYIIPLNTGFYKIEDNWKTSDEYIWGNDITPESEICILDDSIEQMQLVTDKGIVLEEVNLKCDKAIKKASIGFLLKYKNDNKVLKLKLSSPYNKYDIYIYNNTIVSDFKYLVDDDELSISFYIKYFGKNKVYFKIFNGNNEVYKSNYIESGERIQLYDLKSFEDYMIYIYEKKEGLILGNKESEIYNIPFSMYLRKDFLNKCFKVTEVYFNQIINKSFVEKSFVFNKIYLCLDKMISYKEYEGRFIVKAKDSEFELKIINPVIVEICSEVIDDTFEAYIVNKETGDGLLIDFNKKGIMNDLDCPTAPDISLYNISVRG